MTLTFAGVTVTGWANVSWSSEKGHEYDNTPDGQFIKTHASPETTMSITVHITSDLIGPAITAYRNEDWTTGTISESGTGAGYPGVRFIGGTVDSVDQSDAEIDSSHEFTFEMTAADFTLL